MVATKIVPMWPHFVNLLRDSGLSFLAALGTTGLGWWVQGIILFFATEGATYGAVRIFRGSAAMKSRLTENFLIGVCAWLAVTICIYGPIFGWHVVKTVYNDHQTLVSKIGQLDKGPKPCPNQHNLVGNFEYFGAGHHNAQTVIIAVVSIGNRGTPTIARGWDLTITLASGKQIKPTLTAISPGVTIPLPSGQKRKLYAQDALYDKAMTPISTGAEIRGHLVWFTSDATPDEIMKASRVSLSFSDINDQQYAIQGEPGSSHKVEELPYIPGMKHP